MTDVSGIRIKAHQGNIERYRKLLAGKLTRIEREYIMRRIAEERAEIIRLENSIEDDPATRATHPNPLATRELQAAPLPWQQRL